MSLDLGSPTIEPGPDLAFAIGSRDGYDRAVVGTDLRHEGVVLQVRRYGPDTYRAHIVSDDADHEYALPVRRDHHHRAVIAQDPPQTSATPAPAVVADHEMQTVSFVSPDENHAVAHLNSETNALQTIGLSRERRPRLDRQAVGGSRCSIK
jgi:hypothetical protein